MEATVVKKMTHIGSLEHIQVNNVNKLEFRYTLILFYRITDLQMT